MACLWVMPLLLWCSGAVAQTADTATQTPPSTPTTFDFRYNSQPESGLQIFDDGQDTYITFPIEHENTPLLVIGTDSTPMPPLQKTRMILQPTGTPMHRIQMRFKGTYKTFWWHWPGRPILIHYTGPQNRQQPSSQEPVAPHKVTTPLANNPITRQAVWDIHLNDHDLATVFERWSQVVGMKLIWDARQHFLVAAADQYTGRFEDALARVLSSPSIRNSPYPLEACIYSNNPPVLRITRMGEQDCAQ
jgi:hypothetical protein